jgi:hypothetical protein
MNCGVLFACAFATRRRINQQRKLMTKSSFPAAPTPEQQEEFDALALFLMERAAAVARGEPWTPMTDAQGKTLDEMLALAGTKKGKK